MGISPYQTQQQAQTRSEAAQDRDKARQQERRELEENTASTCTCRPSRLSRRSSATDMRRLGSKPGKDGEKRRATTRRQASSGTAWTGPRRPCLSEEDACPALPTQCVQGLAQGAGQGLDRIARTSALRGLDGLRLPIPTQRRNHLLDAQFKSSILPGAPVSPVSGFSLDQSLLAQVA